MQQRVMVGKEQDSPTLAEEAVGDDLQVGIVANDLLRKTTNLDEE